jgi:Arc/MetJ-type ribon-helix-helix transcriptional regulator
MSRTVKFTISVPAPVFKEIEALRRRSGRSRSQFVREAVQGLKSKAEDPSGGEAAAGPSVREDAARYGTVPAFPEITEAAERRSRAIAAAGRFRSGTPDLSADHDKYLEDAYSAAFGAGSSSTTGPGRKP